MMPWNDATSPGSPSHTNMCIRPLFAPTMYFIACGSGSLMLANLVQSPAAPAEVLSKFGKLNDVDESILKAIVHVRHIRFFVFGMPSALRG